MKKLHNYIAVAILPFFCFSATSLIAEQITGKINASGKQYQRIVVPQAYNVLIGNDIGKLRVKDKKGVEIPFILDNPPLDVKQFISIPFTKSKTDSSELIIVDNQNKNRITNYLLKIANTNAHKEYTIEGSNDQIDWFVLVQQGMLNNLQHPKETSVISKIDFPLNEYNWIRIRINNNKSSPINILDIGRVEIKDIVQGYERLKNISLSSLEDKEKKKTLLTIGKQGKATFDIIQFHIKNSFLYTRPAMLYAQEEIKTKKKVSTVNSGEYYFDLNNQSSKHIEIPSMEYPETFFISIQNDDNPALQIDSITLYQIPTAIVAYLDEIEAYTLEADSEWTTPTYDLDKLNIDFSKIAHTATVNSVKIDSTGDTEKKEDSNGNLILIISSIIGALIVFYFGFSLIRDIKKESNS